MSYLINPENRFKKKDFYFEVLPVLARAAAGAAARGFLGKAAGAAARGVYNVGKTVGRAALRAAPASLKVASNFLGKAAGATARGVYNVGKTVGSAALRAAKNVLTQSPQGGNLYQGGQQYQQPVFQQQYQQQYQNPQNVQAAQQNQDNLKVQLAERDKIINTIKSNISTLSRQTQSIVQSINTIQNVINKL